MKNTGQGVWPRNWKVVRGWPFRHWKSASYAVLKVSPTCCSTCSKSWNPSNICRRSLRCTIFQSFSERKRWRICELRHEVPWSTAETWGSGSQGRRAGEVVLLLGGGQHQQWPAETSGCRRRRWLHLWEVEGGSGGNSANGQTWWPRL